MKKTLPKYYVIQRNEKNLLWWKFIKWLNFKYNANWEGGVHNFYGFDGQSYNAGTNAGASLGEFANNPEIITLEYWDECINGVSEEQPKTFETPIPEGHEIDKERSTFERIVFKRIKCPTCVEELDGLKGWYVGEDSDLVKFKERRPCILGKDRNVFPSKAETEASLALSQLCQLRDAWGGWNGNLVNTPGYNCYIVNDAKRSNNQTLTFATKETAKAFNEQFSELIEEAKPFL